MGRTIRSDERKRLHSLHRQHCRAQLALSDLDRSVMLASVPASEMLAAQDVAARIEAEIRRIER